MYETSAQVLDALRAKTGATSDRQLAPLLGVNFSAVNHWRVGRAAMSPEVAVRAAELLGVDPDLMLLRRYAELEKSEAARRIIERMADSLQRAARKAGRAAAVGALALVAAGASVAPAPAQAATVESGPSADNLYIMLCRGQTGAATAQACPYPGPVSGRTPKASAPVLLLNCGKIRHVRVEALWVTETACADARAAGWIRRDVEDHVVRTRGIS